MPSNKKKFNNDLTGRLALSIKSGNAKLAFFGFKSEYDVNASNNNGDSVLLSLMKRTLSRDEKQLDFFREFGRLWMVYGGNEFMTNRQGVSTFMLLVEKGHYSLVVYAILRYKQIFSQTPDMPVSWDAMCTHQGEGVLDFALKSGQKNKVLALLRAGCTVTQRIFSKALKQESIVMVETLLAHQDTLRQPVNIPVLSQVVDLFLKKRRYVTVEQVGIILKMDVVHQAARHTIIVPQKLHKQRKLLKINLIKLACLCWDADLFSMIMKDTDILKYVRSNGSLMRLALRRKNTRAAIALYRQQAQMDSTMKMALLIQAINKKNARFIKTLICNDYAFLNDIDFKQYGLLGCLYADCIIRTAMQGEEVAPLKIMIKKGFIHLVSQETGNTLMISAAEYGFLSALPLLWKKVDFKKTNKHGYNAVTFAAHFGHVPILEWFAKKQVSLMITDKEGRTPILSAARANQRAVVQWLIEEKKIDPARCLHQGTPLFISAATTGAQNVIMYLRKAGHMTDINYQNKCGNTALIAAIVGENYVLSQWLIEQGARLFLSNGQGYHAARLLISAGELGAKVLVSCIENGKVVAGRVLYEIVKRNNLQVLRYVLTRSSIAQSRSALEWCDQGGNTPLLLSIKSQKSISIVRFLLDFGANVRAKNRQNKDGLALSHNKNVRQSLRYFSHIEAKVAQYILPLLKTYHTTLQQVLVGVNDPELLLFGFNAPSQEMVVALGIAYRTITTYPKLLFDTIKAHFPKQKYSAILNVICWLKMHFFWHKLSLYTGHVSGVLFKGMPIGAQYMINQYWCCESWPDVLPFELVSRVGFLDGPSSIVSKPGEANGKHSDVPIGVSVVANLAGKGDQPGEGESVLDEGRLGSVVPSDVPNRNVSASIEEEEGEGEQEEEDKREVSPHSLKGL